MSKKNVDERFIEVFAESIHETLQDIVGESPAKALLFHLNFPESAAVHGEAEEGLRGEVTPETDCTSPLSRRWRLEG